MISSNLLMTQTMINTWKILRLDKHSKLLGRELLKSSRIKIGKRILLTSGIRPLSKKVMLLNQIKEVYTLTVSKYKTLIFQNLTDLRLLKHHLINHKLLQKRREQLKRRLNGTDQPSILRKRRQLRIEQHKESLVIFSKITIN